MTDLPDPAPHPVRRWLLSILGLQVGLALLLFGADVARVLPGILSGSTAPGMTEPTRPGDQTRRYAPGDLTFRPPSPGSRPIPSTQDMPSRLAFDPADWDGGPALTLTGAIAEGDAERLTEWLGTQETPPTTVFLNSPGGSVLDALAIGRTLRGLEVRTAMAETDICLSACPYVLAAGTRRDVAEGAWVGIHQHYFGQNTALPAFLAVEDIQRGQGEVMAYLIEMGIDPALMQHALMTPPSEIYLLELEELLSYRLATAP